MDNTHKLSSAAVPAFMLAGKALLTLSNTATGSHHTYKLQAPGKTAEERDSAPILFVSVLTGPENTSHYTYIGILIRQSGQFRTTAKTRLPSGDKRVLGFEWLARNAARTDAFPSVEVRHHNHCGKCGRVLTVPTSIDTGLGPICDGRRN